MPQIQLSPGQKEKKKHAHVHTHPHTPHSMHTERLFQARAPLRPHWTQAPKDGVGLTSWARPWWPAHWQLLLDKRSRGYAGEEGLWALFSPQTRGRRPNEWHCQPCCRGAVDTLPHSTACPCSGLLRGCVQKCMFSGGKPACLGQFPCQVRFPTSKSRRPLMSNSRQTLLGDGEGAPCV